MQKVISAAEMLELDRLTTERFATPSLLLMEAAAAAAAQAIAGRFSHTLARKPVLILCGRGNNGGDGAALARALWLAGARVHLVLFGRVEQATGDALTNFEIVRHLAAYDAGSHKSPPPLSFRECEEVSAWEEIASARHSYEIIVDALFGTGLSRPLSGIYLQVIEHLDLLRDARRRAHQTHPLIVSLDIPSGLNADQAEPFGRAVRADLTITFAAPKPANVLPPASHHSGQLVIANIGTPPALLEAASSKLFLTEEVDVCSWLVQTRYTPGSYKNTHGHALIIAGSRGMAGAAVLCANAAMRAGAGLVTVATPASVQGAVAAQALPEVMTTALAETESGAASFAAYEQIKQLTLRANIIAIGPGLSAADEETRRLVRAIIEGRSTPVLIDADALNALAPWPSNLRGPKEHPLILTPHQGEMLRLLGTDDKNALADRVAVAREFAVAHELILVLKGTRTLIAGPDRRVFINPTGNAGLGTAGAGDTLTGIIAGFNAQAFATLKDEAEALDATIAAVYLGGVAGDLAAREHGMRAITASDIRERLGAAICALDAEGEAP